MFKETKLIKLFCQLEVTRSQNTVRKIENLISTSDLHWEKVLNIIENNFLQVVVINQLRSNNLSKHIPLKLVNNLTKQKRHIQLKALWHEKQSEKIIKELIAQDLNYIILKTYARNHELWGKERIKIPNDIDILIPIEEFKRTTNILFKSSYQYLSESTNEVKLNRIPSIDFFLPRREEVFSKGSHRVEIHTSVADTYNFFTSPILNNQSIAAITQEIFKRRNKVHYHNLYVTTVSPTTLTLSLFLHLFLQHNFQLGIRLLEFAKVIQTYKSNIKWNEIIIILKKFKLKEYLFWQFMLLEELFPEVVPKELEREVNNYRNNLQIQQKVLLFYMKYKVFFPTNYIRQPSREMEKEWSWAVANRRITNIIHEKAKTRFSMKI